MGLSPNGTALGFTDYFLVEVAWAKLLGAVLLLEPVPARLQETRRAPRLGSR